jgi:apolipoprotein N-acyltransferase
MPPHRHPSSEAQYAEDQTWCPHIAVMRPRGRRFEHCARSKERLADIERRLWPHLGRGEYWFCSVPDTLVDVPAPHSRTVYQVLGDCFARVAIALLVFVLLQMVRLRSRGQR